MKKNLNTAKKAFTLAEVLITMAILGVVMAMTIPTVIKNIKKQQYYAQFSKAYNTINRVIVKSMAITCTLDSWNWDGGDTNVFNDYFKPYFKMVHECVTENDHGCFSSADSYMFLNKTKTENFDLRPHRYILADGLAIQFKVNDPECYKNKTACAVIVADTTGPSGPNTLGRDVFTFYIYPHTTNVMPEGLFTGWDDESGKWMRNSRESIYANCDVQCTVEECGKYCGARLMLDGAINY